MKLEIGGALPAAFLAAVLSQATAQEETGSELEALLERWRAPEWSEREKASEEAAGRWKEWTDADLEGLATAALGSSLVPVRRNSA
ncbi:MAG: hypothetical protein HY720_14815 [Planctomycetes bacterium]|nr:hypothetical protein [Planctomycetota bacterium]